MRLHTYVPTVLRQDSRLGYRGSKSSGGQSQSLDCIHFCLPGPTTLWADMLAARVVQAAACGYAGRGGGVAAHAHEHEHHAHRGGATKNQSHSHSGNAR